MSHEQLPLSHPALTLVISLFVMVVFVRGLHWIEKKIFKHTFIKAINKSDMLKDEQKEAIKYIMNKIQTLIDKHTERLKTMKQNRATLCDIALHCAIRLPMKKIMLWTIRFNLWLNLSLT